LADTTLEQCVIFVFFVFFHCLSLPDDLSLLLTPCTQVRALLSHRHLLRMDPKRPRGSCTAEQRDELPAPHSITSSASASSVGDKSLPVRSVFRFALKSPVTWKRQVPSRPRFYEEAIVRRDKKRHEICLPSIV
jgi:hypothetical protein